MSLSGRQPNNPGYLEAQTYSGDPDNETAPSTLSHEKEIGIEAYTLATLADAVALTVNIPTADQKAALDAATTPSGSNALVTVVDLASYSSPTSTFYNFRTDTGVPASGEVKMDDADPTAATTLSFHNLNREGNNTSNAMLMINNGDAIILQEATDGDKIYNFDVTGAPTQTGGTGASGYITYPVAFFAQGSTAFADADITVAALYPDGSSSAHLAVLNNLSDLNNVVTARTNLGVYSTTEVDAIGDLKLAIASNLSDLANAVTARTNLGVYSTTEVDAIGDLKLAIASNLSDLANAVTARTNLGVYSTTQVDAADALLMVKTANLSDLANAATARTNLDVYSQSEVDAAISSGTTFQYGVYIDQNETSQTTPLVSDLIGTRIDETDSFAASSFSFRGSLSVSDSIGSGSGGQAYLINFAIKKNASGNPFAKIDVVFVSAATTANYTAYGEQGSLGTAGAATSVTATPTTSGASARTVVIERVTSSDELCFRITINGLTGTRDYELHADLTGPREYTGSLLSSSNGTEY